MSILPSRRRWIALLLAGLATGLAAYTYLAARLFPIPLAAAWAVVLIGERKRIRQRLIDLGIYGSRGQVRTALMTLKLAEMTWMKEKT